MELLFLSLTGYKVKDQRSVSAKDAWDCPDSNTRVDVATLNRKKYAQFISFYDSLEPLSPFQAYTSRNGAAQISTGTMLFFYNSVTHHFFCYSFYVTFWNVKSCFVTSTLPHCVVQSHCCIFISRKELRNNLIRDEWHAVLTQSPLFFFGSDTLPQ